MIRLTLKEKLSALLYSLKSPMTVQQTKRSGRALYVLGVVLVVFGGLEIAAVTLNAVAVECLVCGFGCGFIGRYLVKKHA